MLQVLGIAGHHGRGALACEDRYACVDYVRDATGAQQLSNSTCQLVVERRDFEVGSVQESGQARLPAWIPPDLGDYSCRHDDHLSTFDGSCE